MSDFFYEYEDGKAFKVDGLPVKGSKLSEALEDGKIFNKGDIYSLTEQLLDILGLMRSVFPPVVHKNINPMNIIIKSSGEIALLGFGKTRGAKRYKAPEVSEQATPKSDLYSVGKVLSELVKGNNIGDYFDKFLALMTNENSDFRFRDIKTAITVFEKIKDNTVTDNDFSMNKPQKTTSAYDEFLMEKEVFQKDKYYGGASQGFEVFDTPQKKFSVENYENGGSLSLNEEKFYKEKTFYDKYVKLRPGGKHGRGYSPLATLIILVGFAIYGIYATATAKDDPCDTKGNNYSQKECNYRRICRTRSEYYDREKCKVERKIRRENKLKKRRNK